MTLLPFGSWTPDLPEQGNEGVTAIKNAVPDAHSWRGFPDLVTFSDALSARAQGSASFMDTARAAHNFAGDNNKLYRLSSNAWNSVSKAGNYSLASDEMWDFAIYGTDVIAVGHSNPPQYFEVGSSTAFADLSATAPQARHVGVVRDHVVLGNINDATDGEVPNRIHFSPIFTPRGDWTPSLATLAGRRDLEGEGGGWVQSVVGGEFGIILQEYSVWRMTQASPPIIFQLDEVESRQGTPSPRSVVKYGDVVYYLGRDGFYSTTGGGSSRQISEKQVARTFYNEVAENYLNRVVGIVAPAEPLIYWIYPTSSPVPDRVLIYNIYENRWGTADFDLEYVMTLRTEGLDMDTDINALYPNLDLLTISLDSPIFAAQSLQLAGFNSSHVAGWFQGIHLAGEIVTGQHQLIEGRRAIVQNVRPLVDSMPDTLSCNVAGVTRTTDSATFQTVDTAVDSEGDCPILQEGRYFRFKMKTTGSFSNALGIDIDQVVDDGER